MIVKTVLRTILDAMLWALLGHAIARGVIEDAHPLALTGAGICLAVILIGTCIVEVRRARLFALVQQAMRDMEQGN